MVLDNTEMIRFGTVLAYVDEREASWKAVEHAHWLTSRATGAVRVLEMALELLGRQAKRPRTFDL